MVLYLGKRSFSKLRFLPGLPVEIFVDKNRLSEILDSSIFALQVILQKECTLNSTN